MRKQMILLVILLQLISGCGSKSSSSKQTVALPGNFGVFEAFDERILQGDAGAKYPFNIDIVDNGNALILGFTHDYNNNKRAQWIIKKTSKPGVFYAKSSYKGIIGSARLESDESLTICYYVHSSYYELNFRSHGTGIISEFLNINTVTNVYEEKQNSFEKKLELSAAFGYLLNIGDRHKNKINLGKSSMFRFVGLKDEKIKTTALIKGNFIMTLYDFNGNEMASVEDNGTGILKTTLPSDSIYFVSIVRNDISEPFSINIIYE